jgi:hypothetical protein
MNSYNLETAFLEYLKMVNLEMKHLSIIELVQTKRAFFAGCGYLFRALESTSNMATEQEAIYVYKSFEAQINEFFKKEIIQPSKINHDEF